MQTLAEVFMEFEESRNFNLINQVKFKDELALKV